MKFFGSLLLVLFSFILLSCENAENSISTQDTSLNISLISSKPNIIPTQDGFEISQFIDGNQGGTIAFDTIYVNNEGDSIQIQTCLLFLPKSFIGIKEIKMIPDLSSGSIQFAPEMFFDKPAFLDLSYKGVDLAQLGFDSNAKIDFVYKDDNGGVEYILNNECKINWEKQSMYVQKAKLQHFSRYVFVRKCL